MVVLETAVPLLVAAVVASATGFLAAHLFLRAQMQYSLHAPGPAYYVIVGVGLLASLGIIASTLLMLRRITGPGNRPRRLTRSGELCGALPVGGLSAQASDGSRWVGIRHRCVQILRRTVDQVTVLLHRPDPPCTPLSSGGQ